MPQDNKPPAFLFYVNDFASDGLVEAMTTEGVGAYILLLCKAWREDPPGSIPNDDSTLARWARLTPDRWSEVRSAVLAPFSAANDNTARLIQKRMAREYRKLVEKSASARKRAKAAARARWGDGTMQMHCISKADEDPGEIVIEQAFEDFWRVFPSGRKQSKSKAREAFRKAIEKIDVPTLLAAAAEYATSPVGQGRFVKMPTTWLNQECWLDDRKSWQAKDDNAPTPKGKEYKTIPPEEFKRLLDAGKFISKPHRDAQNPDRWFGQLFDTRKVECFIAKKPNP